MSVSHGCTELFFPERSKLFFGNPDDLVTGLKLLAIDAVIRPFFRRGQGRGTIR
jgi:hypothetical protein